MRQRVLYFNVNSLLLSQKYLDSSPKVKKVVESLNQFSPEFFKNIQLDQEAISSLSDFSRKTNVLLFPIQQRFHRDFLVNQGFDESVLAPDAQYSVRYGDTNEINHKISHAAAIDADWFFSSDEYDKAFLAPHFSDRFIDAGINGTSTRFIEALMDKFKMSGQ